MGNGGYALLDFGEGRRLERFGAVVLDRPCPAAEPFERADAGCWAMADARFEGRDQERGEWVEAHSLPERWTVAHGSLQFELKRTDFGHVGLFPEQAENWRWIERVLLPSPACGRGVGGEGGATAVSALGPHPLPLSQRERGEEDLPFSQEEKGETDILLSHRPHPLPLSQRERGERAPSAAERLRVLNLFAYTGGSTLAAAVGGAEVVHVDAAKNIVGWARRNAELSGMADAPIRWITEDALKFVKRELRRGNRYDAVILDPPSYGHGPHGEVWRLSKHLPRLLSLCAELTAGRRQFMLLTCHTPGYDAATLEQMLSEAIGGEEQVTAASLALRSAAGRELPSGVVARCERSIVESSAG